ENSVVEKQAEFEIDTEVFKKVSLDQSIWASKKESYMNKKDIKMKVAAINKEYEEARIKLENSKEDFEKLRLILEEMYQTSSDNNEVLDSKNSAKEYQQKSAYTKKKSKEIKKRKRRAFFSEASSSNTISPKPNTEYENFIDYMMQLIRSLEEKIQHMEWDPPNCS
ncbi:11851_t:CDS:2, partial [Cetraspora pellucida]